MDESGTGLSKFGTPVSPESSNALLTRFGLKFRQAIYKFVPSKTYRWVVAFGLAASTGIGAGHILVGSVASSVCIVEGPSMKPTYQPGARIRTAPVHSPLQRGDIVLVGEIEHEYQLKRIVGLPGETIYLWHGQVYVDRRLLHEPYLPRYTYTFPDKSPSRAVFELGEDQYFVMGDNRMDSTDSRDYGPVARDQVKRQVHLPDNAPRAGMLSTILLVFAKE